METISPYIVDFRSADELPYDHRSVANVDTIYAPNILGRACFFSLWRLVRPSQDGERAWPLAKMLLGAKHGGRPPFVSRIIVREYSRYQSSSLNSRRSR